MLTIGLPLLMPQARFHALLGLSSVLTGERSCACCGPGVRGCNNRADGPLIESFESAFALKVFQMTSDRACFDKAVRLLLR
jgi:hypothetical protein